MKKVIGVLGGSGQIGKRCVAILKRNNYSILASYNKNYVSNDTNCNYVNLDVGDIEAVRKFIQRCDIVLNCAGASYINGEMIARVASDEGVPYIDPSGESFLEDRLEDIANENIFILSAGYFPGLSGLMLEYAAKYFDKPLSIDGFNISKEVPSYSAVEDFILTNLSGFGRSLSSYLDGEIINNECRKNELYREKNYEMYNYLTNEIVRIARKYDLKQANWYNCSFSDEILAKMQGVVYKVRKSGCKYYKNDIEEIITHFKNEVRNDETFSYLKICGKGMKNGKISSVEVNIDSKISSEMSAIVMCYTAISVLENNLKNGIYYAMDVLDINRIINDIDDLNINLSIREFIEEEEYYEGEL